MNDFKPLNTKTADCETLRELLPAYAFGFCDAPEIETVERLLPGCPELAEELAQYQAMADGYLYSAPPVEPPAHLLTNLLHATQPRRFYLRTSWLLAAAVIALLLVLNLWGLAQVAQLSSDLEGRSALLTDFAQDTVLTFNLSAPEDTVSSARATLHCNPDKKVAVIRAENFPPSQGYEVWLWRDGERDSGGTLNVDETGFGTSVFQAPQVMGIYQYISIALPDGAPLVRGNLYTKPQP
jgi:hypothetical protein